MKGLMNCLSMELIQTQSFEQKLELIQEMHLRLTVRQRQELAMRIRNYLYTHLKSDFKKMMNYIDKLIEVIG